MQTYKWLLVSGCVMLLAACISLFFSVPYRVWASDEVCAGGECSVSDTTLTDFAQGNFYVTGLRNVGDGEVQLLPIGLASDWMPDTPLPGKRAEVAAVIYRDKIYVIGGKDETGVLHSEVFSATTLITGPISASGWTTPTNLPGLLASASATISTTQSGAFLYVIGGLTSSGFTSTINYRQLDATGNFAGIWLTASNPITWAGDTGGLVYAQAVAHNGFLYIIGGYNDVFDHEDIFRAPISADGSIGIWIQDRSLPSGARSSHAATVWQSGGTNDYLYVMGGLEGSTLKPEVFISSFDISGTLQAFITDTYPLLPSYAHGATQGNGEIFVTGGYQQGVATGITNSVRSALINTNGQLLGDWTTSFPLPAARAYHGTVMNSGGEVYVVGGYDLESHATDTIYHGSTSGTGSSYASAGTFTSQIIYLGGLHSLTYFRANTTISSTSPSTITFQYRAGTSQDGLLATPWVLLDNAYTGVNITTPFTVSVPGVSYVQYRALYTNTVPCAPCTSSPVLNAFQIVYPAPTPDFQVGVNPTSQSIVQGQSITYTAQLTSVNGFNSSVTMTVSGLPIGASAVFGSNPITPTSSAVLTITTPSTVTVASYPMTLTADSGSITHTASFQLVISPLSDFSIGVNPSSQSVVAGQAITFTAQMTSINGFNSPVTMTVSGLPGGASALYGRNPITPTNSTVLTITTQASVSPAIYPLTLIGDSGIISHTTSFQLVVTPSLPDFAISVNPSTQSIAAGQAISYTAQMTSVNGFNSPVTMTVAGLPPGAIALYASNPIIPTSSTVLTVTTLSTVTVGVYPLTLSGSGGGITHTASFTLSVSASPSAALPDFRITSIQAPPASVTSAYQTITITIINQGTASYGPLRLGNSPQAPVLRQPSGGRKATSGLTSPRAYTKTTDYYFWVAPYIDLVPTGTSDVGNCKNQSGVLTLPYVYSLNMPMGRTVTVQATCWVTGSANPHTYYAQADICDSPPDFCSPTYGHILEKNETNNTYGPVTSGNTSSAPTFFLPMIRR